MIADKPWNAVKDDTLRARESPALDDVRELLSSGDDAVNAGEVAATSPRGYSDEVPKDETELETEGATSSETNISIDHANATDQEDLRNKALALFETGQIADKAIRTNNDIVSTQAVSKDIPNVTVPSPFLHEETVNTEGAITVENGIVLSPRASHTLSIPDALRSDTPGIALSPSKHSTKGLNERGLIFDQPNPDSSLTPSASAKTPKRASPRKKPKLLSPHAVTTPGRAADLLLSAKSIRADDADGTPQIGTCLLRRESLRRKESPSKQQDVRESRTPRKRDTLQRRDTLQEREILQKVIAESNIDHGDETQDAPPIESSTLRSSSSLPGASDNVGDRAQGFPKSVSCEQQAEKGTLPEAEDVLTAVDETSVEKDLHRAMEAIAVYEYPGIAETSQPLLEVTPSDIQGMEAMDKANEVLAKTELENVSQAMEATREQTPNQKKTRSGARFSDDTSMLKDFLNRAQARKAAQKPLLSAPDAPISQPSPRRSPRKTHGSQDGHTLSPQKPRNIANRPGTPPGKPKTDALDSDEGEELAAEPASCRRSTRTRLAAPSKALAGAPSFIPVRRADGTDPVVLQKSQAQELAVTTRANTRRNKGQSKPPLLALQDLPSESADVATTAKQGAEKGKSVAWAERLASYQDAKGEADDAEERRPKVRRLRGLGAVNGTPAAKRTAAVVSTSNGTPAAKRRGKA